MDVSRSGSGVRAEGRRKKRLNLEDLKEDRISDLPDSLLHHILSFLPSTKEAIQTCVLSKRWKNQWTLVPVLIFQSPSKFFDDYDDDAFIRFIDNTLLNHDCSKVNKLHLAYDFRKDTNFPSKIQFATRKHVEELILDVCFDDEPHYYMLPEFLFDNASLVKLDMSYCYFRDDWIVNWGSLKACRMEGCDHRDLVVNILSGSPLLESLEVNDSSALVDCVIASKSLKILILAQPTMFDSTRIEISCPNLEELYVMSPDDMGPYACLPDKTIEKVVSSCPLLRLLELNNCYFNRLVIASKSLKKLVLRGIVEGCKIEISCPKLAELNFCGYYYKTFKLMNTPSLLSANLDFEISQVGGCHEDMAKQIFKQLQNVKELTMGGWFIKILSHVEMGGGLSYPWSNNKILTLDGPNFKHLHGIARALLVHLCLRD